MADCEEGTFVPITIPCYVENQSNELILKNTCHSFNSARMILCFSGKLINVCHIEIYDAGPMLGESRFSAEFRVKIARSRCAPDGLG